MRLLPAYVVTRPHGGGSRSRRSSRSGAAAAAATGQLSDRDGRGGGRGRSDVMQRPGVARGQSGEWLVLRNVTDVRWKLTGKTTLKYRSE